ncbi:MAG: aminopeptidase P family protein, partial [Armatimonadetes bacterium]|nr:aminopeptidase P family protein [Armatimonadota bacterium]
ELECLRRGSAIADRVGEQVREIIRPGITEQDIQKFVVEGLTRAGVAGGRITCQSGVERSADPIYYPVVSSRTLEAGDMLHMEINGSFDGYSIDICRSTVVGRASPEQRRLLGVTLEMLETTIAAIRPGIPAYSLGDVAGRVAERGGFARNFTLEYGGPATYVGHGIGVSSDEPPVLALGDPTPLAEGMILTIEPGLYRTPVGGCRIEDEVLVTGDGAEVVTALERIWWKCRTREMARWREDFGVEGAV